MQEKNRLLRELDSAIDRGDISEINNGIKALTELQAEPIQAEDAMLFAARIQKINKEKNHMNKPKRILPVAIIAAIVMAMGVTAYAAVQLNWFSFVNDDKFVTVRTNENITEQEIKDIINNSEELPEDFDPSQILQPDMEDFSFDSVEEACEQLDMLIPMPADMPEMTLDDATGSKVSFGDTAQGKTVWLNYSDADGRMLGITVNRHISAPGSPAFGYTTHDMDEGSASKYISKSGDEYTTLTESDDTGEKTAHIATIMLGEYEYTLVFFGFEESERTAIIDSTDISALK